MQHNSITTKAGHKINVPMQPAQWKSQSALSKLKLSLEIPSYCLWLVSEWVLFDVKVPVHFSLPKS